MARGGVDFEGIHAQYTTYIAHGSVSAVAVVSGAAYVEVSMCAVAIAGNGIAGYGSAGDPLLGRILKYEDDGLITVQDQGYSEIPGVSGTLPTAGDFLCVNGAGLVSKVASGDKGPAKAVSVDNTADKNTVMVFIG